MLDHIGVDHDLTKIVEGRLLALQRLSTRSELEQQNSFPTNVLERKREGSWQRDMEEAGANGALRERSVYAYVHVCWVYLVDVEHSSEPQAREKDLLVATRLEMLPSQSKQQLNGVRSSLDKVATILTTHSLS